MSGKPSGMKIDASDEMLGELPEASKLIRTPSALKSRTKEGLNVAVLGGPTSLSYQAMHSIFDGESSLNVTYTKNFKEIFELIQQDKVHSGVIPVENTSMGPLPGMYDLILKYPDIHLIGEHIVVEDHCLCALPGTKLEDVEQIISHPWAGAQCRSYLARLVNNSKKPIARLLANDTSAACKVALETPNTATIQQRQMAEKLGLAVLQEGISDDENNKTRFVLVSKEVISLPKFEPMSTTVAFALQNRPNAMYKAFAVFGLRDINIRRMSAVSGISVSTQRKNNEKKYVFVLAAHDSPLCFDTTNVF